MTATATLPRGSSDVLDRDREAPTGATGEILQIPLELIDVDENVRKNVVGIEELAASIAEHGVRQPISVRDAAGARYAINFGQRRYLASELAGRPTIPAFVDNEARTVEQLAIHQLVENLSREDLPPLDRARAMRVVVDAGMTQAELARQLGLGASTVTNDLGLLDAPAKVQELVAAGSISPAHAKAIKGLPEAAQVRLAESAARNGYSAHSLEDNAKYERANVASAERRAKASLGAAKRAAEALAEAKVSKDTPIVVSTPYTVDSATVAKAITDAGWTVSASYGFGETDGCGCVAAKIDVQDGKGSKVTSVCIERDHLEARQAKRDEQRQAEQAKVAADRELLRKAFRKAWAAAPPHPTVARLLLRAFDNYNGLSWTEYSKLDDAEVLDKLVGRVLNDYAYGAAAIPWTKLAEALADETPAKPEPAEPDGPHFGDKFGIPIGGEPAYRIRHSTSNGTLYLTINVRNWRNGDLVATVADPAALTWDAEYKCWRGLVRPIEQPEAVPA